MTEVPGCNEERRQELVQENPQMTVKNIPEDTLADYSEEDRAGIYAAIFGLASSDSRGRPTSRPILTDTKCSVCFVIRVGQEIICRLVSCTLKSITSVEPTNTGYIIINHPV